jgi:hypothetical protein
VNGDRNLKDAIEEPFRRVPVIKDAADPVVAGVLWLVVILTVAGVALAGTVIFPHDKDARSHIIQLAGGMIVILGAYFTARRLVAGQTQQYVERLGATLALLDSDHEATRIGAIKLLQGMAVEGAGLPRNSGGIESAGAWQAAIQQALKAVADNPAEMGNTAASLATQTLEQELLWQPWGRDSGIQQ